MLALGQIKKIIVIMYQKLKKSRTSFSEVVDEMPETWTVELAMMLGRG